MRVRVGEDPCLQHLVGREADTRNDVRWFERGLLNVHKVVLWIAVEHQLGELDQRVVAMRPDLRQVERVEMKLLRIGLGHDLDADSPRGAVSPLDRFRQVACRVVGIGTREQLGFLSRVGLNSLLCLEVVPHLEAFTFCVDPAERMAAVSVHMTE